MQTAAEFDRVLAARARACGKTVAAAESLTGGLVGARLAGQAGASAYFLGSAVCYCNDAKRRVLGVDAALLAREGAVSAACARAMAAGALRAYGADIAVSTTGFAGPDGARVGEVFIGWALADGRGGAERFLFLGSRDAVRASAASAALEKLSNLL